MVLRSDVATSGTQINAGLIHATVAVFHFVSFGTGCGMTKGRERGGKNNRTTEPKNNRQGLVGLLEVVVGPPQQEQE
tara:strand:- start:65 stop:295 length:231 start_codon:yes stop_codon:yes gene_type:complete